MTAHAAPINDHYIRVSRPRPPTGSSNRVRACAPRRGAPCPVVRPLHTVVTLWQKGNFVTSYSEPADAAALAASLIERVDAATATLLETAAGLSTNRSASHRCCQDGAAATC